MSAAELLSDDDLFDRGVSDQRRAVALFPNQGLHEAARMFAGTHPRAIQYLEQAPVLVIGAMLGGPGVRRINGLYIQHRITPLCERGAPLKTVLRTFSLAPPLRKLFAFALFPSAGPTISALSALDPAVLGRIVPEKPGHQRNWLMACTRWRDHVAQRGSPEARFAWAAENLSQAKVKPRDVTTVADFARAPDEHFNEAWKWPRAEEEAEAWHGRLNSSRYLARSPFKPDTVVDLGDHPDEDLHDGFTFRALRTPAEIAEEGGAMRHCVASYISSVVNGACHIVSVRRGTRRIATLELDRDWIVGQLKGRCNADPGGDVRTAAGHYAFAIRKAAKP